MDYTRWVYLNLISSTGNGLALGPVDITTVTSQTEFILPSGATNDDAYLYSTVYINAGTEECFDKYVTGYIGSSKTLTINSACANVTVAANDVLYIRAGASGRALQDLTNTVVALNNLATSDLDTALSDIYLDKLVPASGTADSGSTTTMVDAARTEADNDWWAKGIAIVFTDGTLVGQSACVYDFVASTDTMAFRPAVTQAVSTHTYVLVTAPTCGGVVAP